MVGDLIDKSLGKNNFLNLFAGIRIKTHFPWNAKLFISFRSSFKSFFFEVISWTSEKREVSSANSLGFETKLLERSLINIKKKRRPRTDPWGTLVLTLAHEKYRPFKTTVSFLTLRKSNIKFNKLPLSPFCFNL